MKDLKLELSQLKNYLGTGLKIEPITKFGYNRCEPIMELDLFSLMVLNLGSNEIKPLMYRLSDLDKFIPELGFVPADIIFPKEEYKTKFDREVAIEALNMASSINCSCVYFAIVSQLCDWHFWVFDQKFFDENLIIDKFIHFKPVDETKVVSMEDHSRQKIYKKILKRKME